MTTQISSDGYRKVKVVQGDRHPAIRIQYIDKVTNKPVDISSANITAKGRFREAGASTSLYDATMTKVDGGIQGMALWQWPADGTDYDPTDYEIQPFLEYTTGSSPHTSQNPVKVEIIEKFAEPDA